MSCRRRGWVSGSRRSPQIPLRWRARSMARASARRPIFLPLAAAVVTVLALDHRSSERCEWSGVRTSAPRRSRHARQPRPFPPRLPRRDQPGNVLVSHVSGTTAAHQVDSVHGGDGFQAEGICPRLAGDLVETGVVGVPHWCGRAWHRFDVSLCIICDGFATPAHGPQSSSPHPSTPLGFTSNRKIKVFSHPGSARPPIAPSTDSQ